MKIGVPWHPIKSVKKHTFLAINSLKVSEIVYMSLKQPKFLFSGIFKHFIASHMAYLKGFP